MFHQHRSSPSNASIVYETIKKRDQLSERNEIKRLIE